MRTNSKETSKKGQTGGLSDDLLLSASKNAKLIEDKHEKIVAGVSTVLFKKGFHPTTTRELAEACGMSMGQFYHYVSSKDDVLYLLHKHMIRLWREYLKTLKIDSIGDPVERLRAALRSSLDFILKNNSLFRFIIPKARIWKESTCALS